MCIHQYFDVKKLRYTNIFNVHTQGHSSARVVNQLLTEMDGMQSRRQVFVMAATNRPGLLSVYLNCNYNTVITVITVIITNIL